MRNYYIIEHPTRGVYTGFTLDSITGRPRPAFDYRIQRSEGVWLTNRAHAMRALARIRKYGVKQCYIMKASTTAKGDVVFTQDNMHQV